MAKLKAPRAASQRGSSGVRTAQIQKLSRSRWSSPANVRLYTYVKPTVPGFTPVSRMADDARSRRRPLAGGDRAAFVGEDHGVDPVACAELRQHIADVALDRRLLDGQRSTDLAVGAPLGDE